jgi:DNA polymerase-3 subunit beta
MLAKPDTKPATLHITQRELHSALSRVKHAISTEQTRYYLNGVYVHNAKNGKARFVATDGHRLASVSVDVKADASFHPCILPTSFVQAAIRAASKKARWTFDCPLVVEGNKVMLHPYGEETISDTLVSGTFPDYLRVVPQGDAPLGVYAIPSERLGTAAKALTAYKKNADPKGHNVLRLTVAGTVLTMTAKPLNSEPGISFAPASAQLDIGIVEAGKDTGPREIGFNGDYLADIANACKDSAVLHFHFFDKGRPCLFKGYGENDAYYVLMPVRV